MGNDTQQFLDILAGQKNAEFLFTCIHPVNKYSNGTAVSTSLYGKFESCKKFLDRKNAAGFGIYVTINEPLVMKTGKISRKKSDIKNFRACWMDYDGPEKSTVKKVKLPIPPSLTVFTSPGKFHKYFALRGNTETTPENRILFERIQNALVVLGGDKASRDISRVLRLVGYHNTKPDLKKPFKVICKVEGKNLKTFKLGKLAKVFGGPTDSVLDEEHRKEYQKKYQSEYRKKNYKKNRTSKMLTDAKDFTDISSVADLGGIPLSMLESFDPAEAEKEILKAKHYYEPLRGLCMFYANAGKTKKEIVKYLRAIMKVSLERNPKIDRENWNERYNGINVLVKTAVEKVKAELAIEGLKVLPVKKAKTYFDGKGLKDEYKSFDVSLFPKSIQKLIFEIQKKTKVPTDPIISTIISTMGAAINKTVIINERPEADLHHNLSIGVISSSPSGGRKSAIDYVVNQGLYKYYKTQMAEVKKDEIDAKAFADERRSLTAKRNYLKKKENPTDKDNKKLLKIEARQQAIKDMVGVEPIKQDYLYSDITEERLSVKMMKNGERAYLHSAEARNVVVNLLGGRYGQSTKAGTGLFICGLTGDYYSRHRMSSEDVILWEPCLNVSLKVQPDLMAEVLENDEFKLSGLIARIGLAIYDYDISAVALEDEDNKDNFVISGKAVDKWNKLIFSIMDSGDYEKPVNVGLSPEAKEIRRDFNNNKYVKWISPGGKWADRIDLCNKVVSLACKYAVVYMGLRDGGKVNSPGSIGTIDAESMRFGIHIATVYECQKMSALFYSSRRNQLLAAKDLLKVVCKKFSSGFFSVGTLVSLGYSKQSVLNSIRILTEIEYIEQSKTSTTRFMLKPGIDEILLNELF